MLPTLALALLLVAPPPDRPTLVIQIDRGDEACVDVDLPHLHESVELALGWALEHRQAAPAAAGRHGGHDRLRGRW